MNKKDFEGLTAVLKEHWEKTKEIAETDKVHWDQKFEEMMKEIRGVAPVVPMHQNKKRTWLYRSIAAAAVIAIVITGAYIFLNKKPQQQTAQTTPAKLQNDVAPGGNKATLTLADGSTIVLDSAHNGAIAHEGSTKIVKLDSGQLAYNRETANANREGEVQYNILSTPRGGQYQIVLADGTKVWLNSASSLKYPTAFTGNVREVQLTGEGYFEVAKNPSKPFHVKTGTQDVEVLGTHFNINAYNDEEAISTTLLEGAVKVSLANGNLLTLKPGEQSQIKKDASNIQLIKDADIDKVMAWKNGWFEFDDTKLPVIMRQVSRWYDVDVVYEGTPTNETFGGRIAKNLPLSSVLQSLESNGVKFKQDGKKIIVQP